MSVHAQWFGWHENSTTHEYIIKLAIILMSHGVASECTILNGEEEEGEESSRIKRIKTKGYYSG